MKENIPTKAIRKRKYANILVRQGFRMIAVRQNKRFPEQDVYIFEYTPELDKALGELIASA